MAFMGPVSAANALDPSFGAGGVVLIQPAPVSGVRLDRAYGIATQSDGAILLAGRTVDSENLTFLPAVARLLPDGTWDETFGDHGLFMLPFGTPSAPAGGSLDRIGLLSDGSVVAIGGTFRSPGSGSDFHSCTLLLKLDASGALDTTFGGGGSGNFCFDFAPEKPGTTYFAHPDDLQIGGDDTIYVSSITNLEHGAAARFSSSGVLDTGYGVGGVVSLPVGAYGETLALQPDQRLLVVGQRNYGMAEPTLAAFRFLADGAIDSGFGIAGEYNLVTQSSPAFIYVQSAATDRNDRLLVGLLQDPGFAFGFARISHSGSADTTFNPANQQPDVQGLAEVSLLDGETGGLVAARPVADGHILGIGFVPDDANESSTHLALVRLAEDAAFDPSFGDSAHPGWSVIAIGSSRSTTSYPRASTADGRDRILIAADIAGGAGQAGCVAILRVIPDALFDGSFDLLPAAPDCPL
jgi:uncharacterized delta-60 repeat protein